MARKPPAKSSKSVKAVQPRNGKANLMPPIQKGHTRNPQGINGFMRLGKAVMDRMENLVPVLLPDGTATVMKGDDALAHQLVRGALDYDCKSCSERQHLTYVHELLKRIWPAPREDKPVVPIQIIVQAGPQETFVKQVMADGQVTSDGVLDALGDTPVGGNGKETE